MLLSTCFVSQENNNMLNEMPYISSLKTRGNVMDWRQHPQAVDQLNHVETTLGEQPLGQLLDEPFISIHISHRHAHPSRKWDQCSQQAGSEALPCLPGTTRKTTGTTGIQIFQTRWSNVNTCCFPSMFFSYQLCFLATRVQILGNPVEWQYTHLNLSTISLSQDIRQEHRPRWRIVIQILAKQQASPYGRKLWEDFCGTMCFWFG